MLDKEFSGDIYYEPFLEPANENKTKIGAALERAWKNRDFEIDKYWSRATYFWTFIASAFVGYGKQFGENSGKLSRNAISCKLPWT